MTKCKLLGYKGEFDAYAKNKHFCDYHKRDTYIVESVCNTVRIRVFARVVEDKIEQFKAGGWPIEFYYS